MSGVISITHQNSIRYLIFRYGFRLNRMSPHAHLLLPCRTINHEKCIICRSSQRDTWPFYLPKAYVLFTLSLFHPMRHYLSISISSFIHLFIFIHSSALFNIYTRLLIPSLSPLISLFPHCCSFSLSSYPHYFVTPHCSQLTVHQITSLKKKKKKL